MSKSIGNIVDPIVQLAKYSSDSFRYYLMRNGIYGSDIPFSESNLVYTHNSDLADVLGNLVHRATNLCVKNCEAGRLLRTSTRPTLNLLLLLFLHASV
jgi:methionyl-tRNA synthetase